MTVSLSDLKSKRAAMRADENHDRYTNAVTLVLEASDDLIEIAEAAREWQMATQTKSRAARKRLLAALAKITP